MKLQGAVETETKGCVTVNRRFKHLLKAAGLTDFEAVYRYDGGTVIKDIRQRTVTFMELEENGLKRRFYLKRHKPEQLGPVNVLMSWIAGRRCSQGWMEFDNICRFRQKGLPTVEPVACGEKNVGFSRMESFVITEDVFPYIPLEKIIEEHPECFQGESGGHRKRKLIEQVAALARKMHLRGFNHRDFNATHVLVRYRDASVDPELALIDLQRVDKNKLMRFRWIIKTMAELCYTLPAPLFDQSDHRLLFCAYKGKKHVNLPDRIQLYWIRRKTEKIRRHTEHIRARRGKISQKGIDPVN